MTNKTPSEQCKEAGLKSLKELSLITEQSENTLINWSKNEKKKKLFECVILGAAQKKATRHS